jgi:Flp pilus assembly protein TadG
MTERQGERGQALVWVEVFMPIFLAVIGLALDVGVVFDREQGLLRLARSAARMGAEQIDVAAYRVGNGEPVLDPAAARAAALTYIDGQATGVSANVTADRQSVVVRVSQDVPLDFLRIVHLDTAPIAATGVARIATGAIATTP